MLGTFNPPRQLALTIVTAQLVVRGTFQTRLQRLTDIVNEPERTHLVLFDATLTMAGTRRTAAESVVAQVPLEDVLFVHSSDPTESGGVERMPKQAIDSILLLPPYTIEGKIHLPYEEELHQALDALGGRFVPVTEARYWVGASAESATSVDLVVVNHARVHVAVPSTVEWLREPAATPDSDGGQNPW